MTETVSAGDYLYPGFVAVFFLTLFVAVAKFTIVLERPTSIFCKLRKHFHQVDSMWA